MHRHRERERDRERETSHTYVYTYIFIFMYIYIYTQTYTATLAHTHARTYNMYMYKYLYMYVKLYKKTIILAVASPMILRTDVSESSQLPEIACVSCGEFVSVAWVVMVHQLLGITTEVPTAMQRPVVSGLSRYTLCKAWRNGGPTRSSHVGWRW